MINKLITFTILAYATPILFAYKYELQFRDEEMFLPCPAYPNNFLDKFVTIPENMTMLSDVSFYVAGDITIIYDFKPFQNYPACVEIYKRNRGSWQKTVYTIRRDDFCTSFFNPSEIWSTFLKEVPQRLRVCPLTKGLKYPVNVTTEQWIEMPSGSLEGEYWAHFETGDKNYLEGFCCIDCYFSVYRV